ncbi:carboxypeptidase Y precursor [Ophiocordyceps camponoti-floridani]|uniref:carboxypeptidase C n=1 Tax=Ophiocordyceps camponoti-floridani TaxID=2030778 RepID=A0A8H4VCX7_9HYPO|nr:carboxypeptidase Y precursor [Ophiocordyceps camponoti-floridani]
MAKNIPVKAPASQLADLTGQAGPFDTSTLGIDKVKQFSGYLDDDTKDKHLFYWFFESRGDPANDPVVLWLEGGPACSSMISVFESIGPARIEKDLSLKPNPFSWTQRASIIFLDSPVNTGFSSSSEAINSTADGAKDLLAAMTLFFDKFPQYGKQSFFLAGNSIAAMDVSELAAEIISHPQQKIINLKGAILANGVIDYKTQHLAIRPMVCGEGGHPPVLTKKECQALAAEEPGCQKMIQACYDNETDEALCQKASARCSPEKLSALLDHQGTNRFNVHEPCTGDADNSCNAASGQIEPFMNQPDVIKTLGVLGDKNRDYCSVEASKNITDAGDQVRPHQRRLAKVLDMKIPVLAYAGDGDLIGNWLGIRDWTNALEWSGHDAFEKAELKPLKLSSSGRQYGEIKSARGLTYGRVFKAGFSAALDQPEAVLDLFERFTHGEWNSE